MTFAFLSILVLILLLANAKPTTIRVGFVINSEADVNLLNSAMDYFTASCQRKCSSTPRIIFFPINMNHSETESDWTDVLAPSLQQDIVLVVGRYNANLESLIAGSVPYIIIDPVFYDQVDHARRYSIVSRKIWRQRASDVISSLPTLAAMLYPLRKYVRTRGPNQNGNLLVVIVDNTEDYEVFINNLLHYDTDTLVIPIILPVKSMSRDQTRIKLAEVRKTGSRVIYVHSQDREFIVKLLENAMSLDMVTHLYDWVLTYMDMDGLADIMGESLLSNCSSILGFQMLDRNAFKRLELPVPGAETLSHALLLDALDILVDAVVKNGRSNNFTAAQVWHHLRNFPVDYEGAMGSYGSLMRVPGPVSTTSRVFIRHSANVIWKGYHSCAYDIVHTSKYTLQVGRMIDEKKDNLGIDLPIFIKENDTRHMPLFNHQPVRVALAIAPPFVFETINDKNEKEYTGLMIEYLNMYAEAMNFTFTIHSSDQVAGIFNDGVWMGSIAHLVNEEASIAVGGISVNTERAEYIDFTEITFPGMLSILMKRPAVKSTMWQFLYPFSAVMWISIFVVFLIISVLLVIMDKIDRFDDNFSTMDSFYYVAGILLSGSTDSNPQSSPSRILVGCFMFFSIVVFQSYVANMAAFLTTRDDFDDIPQNMHDLISENTMQLASLGEADIIIKQSKTEPLLSLKSRLFNEQLHYDNHQDAIDDLRNRSFGKMALILVSSTTQYVASQFCDVMYSHHNTDPVLYALALPKGAQIKKVFDTVITEARELGKDLRIIKQWYSTNEDCEQGGNTAYTANLETESLSFVEMVGVFLVVLIGMGVAVAIGLSGEIMFRFRRQGGKESDDHNGVQMDTRTNTE